MEGLLVEEGQLERFREYLKEEERSELTIEKYLRDIKAFSSFLNGRRCNKRLVMDYKHELMERYKPTSVNSILAALKSFFSFCGREELKVKSLKIQKNMFSERDRELSQGEYRRLLSAAKHKKNERLWLIMQTICSTGIRVSELEFITVKAVEYSKAEVVSKGKRRAVFITPKLRKLLLEYVKQRNITEGSVFISRNGIPLNRHRIWADMKALCEAAKVSPRKVFPHNLRHLFARSFYALEKDLGRLADILGHSNINTTRIYTMECGKEHERILSRLSLLYNN